MIKSDFHMHTFFCDGHDSPEDMVKSAVEKGFDIVGITCHAYTDFDLSYCIRRSRIKDFLRVVERLKREYSDRIKVCCGVEQDMYATLEPKGFDYVIGSLHYVDTIDGKVAIDMDEETFVKIVQTYFDGDFYAMAESYFKTLENVIEITRADIVGHFDLVSKYNENGKYFDEENERYVKAYTKALDKIIESKVPFEINTGAISRGYKTEVYPNKKMREYILSKGGKFILSSDSHTAKNIGFYFEEAKKLIPEESLVTSIF